MRNGRGKTHGCGFKANLPLIRFRKIPELVHSALNGVQTGRHTVQFIMNTRDHLKAIVNQSRNIESTNQRIQFNKREHKLAITGSGFRRSRGSTEAQKNKKGRR